MANDVSSEIRCAIESECDFDRLATNYDLEDLARVLFEDYRQLEMQLSEAEDKLRECWKARGISP